MIIKSYKIANDKRTSRDNVEDTFGNNYSYP
jgi:hypothetical protein